jgi:hypothetical protein
LIVRFMTMDFQGDWIGYGGKPDGILHDERALEEAKQLNRQLKQIHAG